MPRNPLRLANLAVEGIIDRKTDPIVTSGGKNISPQKLEEALAADPLVSQALVVGDGRPYLVALIAPGLAEVQRLDLDRSQPSSPRTAAVASASSRQPANTSPCVAPWDRRPSTLPLREEGRLTHRARYGERERSKAGG